MEVTLYPQPQPALDLIYTSENGNLYAVDADIVLRTACPYIAPGPEMDARAYAYTSVDQFRYVRNERFVARLLQRWPHANLARPVATDFDEGIYLRRYQPLPLHAVHAVPVGVRLGWYADILRGLSHLHELRIAHYDLCPESIMLDAARAAAVVCDFGHASQFGDANIEYSVAPGELVPRNGPARKLSAATDMFAAASLLLWIENRADEPQITLGADGELVLPEPGTGSAGLDDVIRRAWKGGFDTTKDMLRALEALGPAAAPSSPADPSLHARVEEWRADRIAKYRSVVIGLLSDEELTELTERHGLEECPPYGTLFPGYDAEAVPASLQADHTLQDSAATAGSEIDRGRRD